MNTHMRCRSFLLSAMVLAALTLMPPAQAQPSAVAGPPSGHPIQPELLNGSPSCQAEGYRYGFKLFETPPKSGTFGLTNDDGTLTGDDTPSDPSNSVTVEINGAGTQFDWNATLGIDALLVVSANLADLFRYPQEATNDTRLHGPVLTNPNSPSKFLHIEFCYDYELSVAKTAETGFIRTYEWGINKTASPDTLTLGPGEQGESLYRVSVYPSGPPVDSDWRVEGRIQIFNKTPFDATVTAVDDTISPDIPAPTNCDNSLPISLPAGKTLFCSYSEPLPDGSSRTNTATVKTTGTVDGATATAAVEFGEPSEVVNQTITVDDTSGESWQCSAPPQSCSWGYTETFSCPEDQGPHVNTATIEETGQSASVTVAVTCEEDPPPPSELFCLWSPNKKYLVLGHSDFQRYVDETCPNVGSDWTFDSCTADPSGGSCIVTSGDQLCVQADRDGSDSDGRRYTVKITSTPACAGTGTVGYILVPHDQSSTKGCLSASSKSCP